MLAWCDLETTGLSPEDDDIVEIAMIVTGDDGTEKARYEAVVRPEGEWRSRMGSYVTDMHTKSGLIEEIDSGKSLATVDAEVAGLLGSIGKHGEFYLAGSGVSHFDHRFIVAKMPLTAEFFRYATFDVGVLRRMLTAAGRDDLVRNGTTYKGDAFHDKPHRSMADIEDHLAEWREYAPMLKGIVVP